MKKNDETTCGGRNSWIVFELPRPPIRIGPNEPSYAEKVYDFIDL